jgi:hypothetical protein
MQGRNKKQDSRATEFRGRLMVWKRTPESFRPSLRALARELSTSHALLQHYLNNLEKWQAEEDWRRAREIRARANAEGRPMTPWEEQQSRALDRRAFCLFIESAFEDSVKRYEREIERCIKDGKMPTPGYPKLLRTITSIRGGPAAQRAAQRAQAVLEKYFSSEGKKAIREQLRKTPRPDRAVRKVPEARYHEIRLQKLVERFEELGGVLLLDEGQVRYFVPEETAVSRILVGELAKYHDRLRQRLTELVGKLDFEKIQAEISQRFPAVSLNSLESKLITAEGAGNSAKPEGGKSHALA